MQGRPYCYEQSLTGNPVGQDIDIKLLLITEI